jgi:hypothetical protein
MQQFVDSINEQRLIPNDLDKDKNKGGCPEGWELAPQPWPYNETNNPCKDERPERPEDEEETDDTVVTGIWFCPMDSSNFPWPGCCIQSGVDYSNMTDIYPDNYENANGQTVPDWLQTYFEYPIGTTYSSNVECNANSGCSENTHPNGSWCGPGGDIDPPIDDPTPPGINISPTLDRLKELAGIKKKK